MAEVWVSRSCRSDLDLHAAPQPCTASASWGLTADSSSLTVVMRSCFYFHVDHLPTLAQPCSDLSRSVSEVLLRYGFTGAARACTTTLFADDRQLAVRSPGCARRVIPGTASDWPCMMCMIPAWYTCSSKPRATTSTQASFARLHERRRALPPLRSVPSSLCRTWHDPLRRRSDPLAMRSICAGEVERPWSFRERRSCVERLATSAACR